jgi:hypothetical protein
MEWQHLITGSLERVLETLEKALANTSQAELDIQPNPDSNSMGWIAWHLTRTQDRSISNLMGDKQIWIKDEWFKKFKRAPDTQDTGFGHTPEDVAAFKSPEVVVLLAYHKAVLERSKRYLESLAFTELNRKVDHPRFPTVGVSLVALLNDSLQHAGQVAYLRGLLKGKGWMNA